MRQALGRIYEQHRQGLFTLALAVARHPALAEDAVHEAFARLLRSRVMPEGDLTAYVYAAVRHAAIDLRRRRPEAAFDAVASVFADPAPDPATRAVEDEQLDLLREAVDRLPDADRQVVLLKTHAGLTFDQIAQALDQPLATVASRYRRALEKLRPSLEPAAEPR